jgi:hypothetical protein
MRADPDKCLNCAGRYRSNDLDSPSEQLDKDGTFFGLPYWFCSVECYKKKLRPFIDDKYDFDKQPEDDKEYLAEVERITEEYFEKTTGGLFSKLLNPISWRSQNDYVAEHTRFFRESFLRSKQCAILDAERELGRRLDAEWEHQRNEENAAHEKIAAKQNAEILKLLNEQKEREAREDAIEEMLEEKPIPFQYRFDHTHVIAGSGHGKTTLLMKQFIDDLNMPKHPAVVVIDPKGTMVDQLRRLRAFQLNDNQWIESGEWDWNHMLIIDPTLFPPALNMFAPPKRKYAPPIAQQLENNTISLFQYIFITKGSALTDKQMTCFSFAVPLILSIPNATIHTLLDLMSDKPVPKTGGMRPDSPFKPFIDKLGPTAKRFFCESFYDTTEYGATKDQIATRIFGMLRYPAFDAMFSTTENKLDMFDCLQKGKVVLISSPKSILGTEGSKIFSRYMVALTLQAAFERITVDKKTWHPAFLVIDEAQDVVDEVKTPELLEQAREFKLGVTIAHQNIKGQLNDALFSSISANTRIKYAGTRSHQDALMMARDMHCEPEFIMQQNVGSFACYVGGMTTHPFQIQLKLGEIDDYEKMSNEEFKILRSVLAQDFGITPETHGAPTEAEPSRTTMTNPPASPPIITKHKSDPSKPAKWTLG